MAGITRTLRHSGVETTSREGLLACLLLYLVTLTMAQRVEFVETNAQTNPDITLQIMIKDDTTGKLYVGSVNTIYQLSEDLELILQEKTGPVQDNQECFPPPGPCVELAERQTMNNINKLLALDGDKLISCGSVFQGTCQIRSASNLAMLGNNTSEEVAANTHMGTTIGFVAKGPVRNVLYVASSHAQWLEDDVPTISSRSTVASNNPKNLFKVIQETPFSQGAKIGIPTETLQGGPGTFNISYVYGFPSGNFSYFIGIQPENENLPTSPYRTKLARVCQKDYNFYSYIELPLTCKKDGVNYNLARSAYVTTLGGDLEGSTEFQRGDEVLFVTFSKSNGKTLEPVADSAICMYSMKYINQKFWDRRKTCASGTGSFEIPWQQSANQNCDTRSETLVCECFLCLFGFVDLFVSLM